MAESQPRNLVAGRYELQAVIGRGGMGTVWRGLDTRLHRPVAVKLLARRESGSDHSAARFEREAMAVAALRSPHIVQIYDYGLEGPTPFMVMELLEGSTLADRLRERRRLPLDAVVRIVAQSARGLTTAHEAGIIHRDFKPANVFLVRDRAEELVKLLDFGLAKPVAGVRRGERITATGALVGTPPFMSPEQILGDEIDHRTDLWALAVVAFVSLTGRAPFRGEPAAMLEQICQADSPRPTDLFADLPCSLDRFFAVALAKQRSKRFQSALELSEALARSADASPSAGSQRFGPPARPVTPANAGEPPSSASTEVSLVEPTTRPAGPRPVKAKAGRRKSPPSLPRSRALRGPVAVIALLCALSAGAWLLETHSHGEAEHPRTVSDVVVTEAADSDSSAPRTPGVAESAFGRSELMPPAAPAATAAEPSSPIRDSAVARGAKPRGVGTDDWPKATAGAEAAGPLPSTSTPSTTARPPTPTPPAKKGAHLFDDPWIQ